MITTIGDGSYDAVLKSFTASVKADLDSPVTSNFGNRILEYRTQAQRLVEEIDGYTTDFERLRKLSKEVEDTISNLTKQLFAFGQIAKEVATKWTARSESQNESDAAAVLMKMECYIRDEADLTNLQMRNWQSNIVSPFLSLMETGREIRNRGVERSCRDYENKYVKAEAEARKHAKHAGYTRSHLGHGELAEQLTRERLMVQYELCKFLMSVDIMEDRRGPQLLRHFMELVRNQNSYYSNRVKMNEDFRHDMAKLEERMMTRNANRCAQRNALWDLRGQLEANDEFRRSASGRRSTGRDSVNRGSILSGVNLSNASAGLSLDDSLSELATSTAFSPDLDFTQSGYLYKKSNKKLHKQWQKRRCRIEDGHFWLSHSDETVPPTKLSLLVSDCKPSKDDPKAFDLYCCERTYHLQADSETDAKRWMLALKREIERGKAKMLSADTPQENNCSGSGTLSEFFERKSCIIKVRQLPGNNICADCSSKEDVQWLSNMGALVCIACSGVHRELGVHVSRIQSLNLDVISPLEFLVPLSSGNIMINRLFEHDAAKCATWKPIPGCTRFDRQRFIQMKYRDRAFIQKLEDPDACLAEAFNECDFEGAYRALLSPNLTKKPFLRNGPFHHMVLNGSSVSLPLADLIMQLRIEIPDMEMMLMDCIRCGNTDMVAVLLRYRSVSSTFRGIHLQSLITCAKKAEQKKIVEMLHLLESGEGIQAQYVNLPQNLFISTPDSASLSRSSSSISPCPRFALDSTSQHATSTPVNVLMRNGTTVSIPPSSDRSMDDAGNSKHKVKQILDESESGRIFFEDMEHAVDSIPVTETCTQGNIERTNSIESVGQKVLLTSEIPLQASNTQYNVSSTHALPNNYSRVPGDGCAKTEFSTSLNNIAPPLHTFLSLPTGPILPVPAAPMKKKPYNYGRSTSENTRASSHPENVMSQFTTSRNRLWCAATENSSVKGNGLIETTFAMSASLSLDPISLEPEMNAHVKANEVQEETIDNERYTLTPQEDHTVDSYFTDEKASSKASTSALKMARSSFMPPDECARFSAVNPSEFRTFGSRPGDNEVQTPLNGLQPETPRNFSRSARITRPAPAPPAAVGIKVKPPIPIPRRFPSAIREQKQRDYTRRCRAMYDCNADNADELSFRQGDIIIVTKDKVAGESDNWMQQTDEVKALNTVDECINERECWSHFAHSTIRIGRPPGKQSEQERYIPNNFRNISVLNVTSFLSNYH